MLLSVEKVTEKIKAGKTLYLAGDEKLLKALPKGKWIGGTIPYFMDDYGGKSTSAEIFVTEQPDYVSGCTIKMYQAEELENIPEDSVENGYTVLIIPALSEVHIIYANEAPEYEKIYDRQIIGWISGVDLKDLGKVTPKVINGETGEITDKKAVALHAELPKEMYATIGIINIFKQGNGDTIIFDKEGFSVTDCYIKGKKQNFCDYLLDKKADLKNPLVADYLGALVNVSFQSIDEKNKTVNFYAPVFKGTEYKLAAPIENYVTKFDESIPKGLDRIVFSCNCILNYLYGELEGKKTGNITGPITFGEIAHQLLNQTLVYLNIHNQ